MYFAFTKLGAFRRFLLSPTPQPENFPENYPENTVLQRFKNFQRSENQKTEIYKNLEVIGILKTSAKSNSVYPTLIRGEKCLSYKIGEK